MKHIVIYIITFFLMTNSAIGQDLYRIEEANCSFILPETWELVSEEVSNLRKGKLIITLFIDKSNSARDVSFLEGHEYNVYIENLISPNRPEAKGEKRYLSDSTGNKKQESLDKRIKSTLEYGPKNWKGASTVDADFYYDQDKHAEIETIEMYKANVGNIVSIDAIFLGSSRRTVFEFLWEGENSEKFFDTVYAVIDSFEYDQGHGFAEGGGLSSSILGSSASGKSIMEQKAVSFLADALIFAVCLWLGMKITGEEGSFFALVFISAVSSLVGLIPFAGWILSIIVMYILICKMLEMEFFPDAVIMVVVAQLIATFVAFAFIAKLVGK